jgi:hypothetical protein
VTFGFSVVGVLMVAIGHPRFCAASSRDALLAWSVVFHFGGGHAMRSHQVAPSQAIMVGPPVKPHGWGQAALKSSLNVSASVSSSNSACSVTTPAAFLVERKPEP